MADSTLHKGGIRMAEEIMSSELAAVLKCIENNKNFLLSGGAGSGKTYSLIQILKLISQRSPAATIACITYTNAAAIEIENRANIKNLWVSTIHDFFWDNIAPFQKGLKSTLLELINDPESKIKNPTPEKEFVSDFSEGIQYKEYVRLSNGEISHDEVLILSNKMYSKYVKLCSVLKDKYDYILVDEYQDTSHLVIEILLDFLPKSPKKNIIGFFGDSMQAIYENGIGDLNSYIESGKVIEIKKEENRRNPLSIITIANKIRTDGISQRESNDLTAPNMYDGKIIQGSAVFLYSSQFSMERVKQSSWCQEWDFGNSTKTKELRLTHNLIASEAGFEELMEIYDADPIYKFKQEVRKQVGLQGLIVTSEQTFDEVVTNLNWQYVRGENKGRNKTEVFLSDSFNKQLYALVRDCPYIQVEKLYLDKDMLLDDKKYEDNEMSQEPKRDKLLQQLFSIELIIHLYQAKKYNELIRKTSFRFSTVKDKATLKSTMNRLISMRESTIEEVIEYANEVKLCLKDDRFQNFIEKNSYLYDRVKHIKYSVFQNLYNYLEGYIPLSTQHKIKGLEFENVLVVLHNGGWSNYNFEYLLDESIYTSLKPAKQKTYDRILKRTQKLFYVCCTRSKKNLVVYCPSPTENMIAGAQKIFGVENVHSIDEDVTEQ